MKPKPASALADRVICVALTIVVAAAIALAVARDRCRRQVFFGLDAGDDERNAGEDAGAMIRRLGPAAVDMVGGLEDLAIAQSVVGDLNLAGSPGTQRVRVLVWSRRCFLGEPTRLVVFVDPATGALLRGRRRPLVFVWRPLP